MFQKLFLQKCFQQQSVRENFQIFQTSLRAFIGVETAALTFRTKLITAVISVTANDSLKISF